MICTNCGGDLELIASGYDEATDRDYKIYKCKVCGDIQIVLDDRKN